MSHAPDTRNPEKHAIDKRACDAGQCSLLQNDAGTEVSYWHKSDTAGSWNVLDRAMKNPGALAGATGAKDVVESVCLAAEYTAAFPILAMHWGALV